MSLSGSDQFHTHRAIFSAVSSACSLPAKRVHVKMPGHDFVKGVERSPNLHSIAQAVEQLRRERTEIAIPVLRLAFRQFSDHQIAVVL